MSIDIYLENTQFNGVHFYNIIKLHRTYIFVWYFYEILFYKYGGVRAFLDMFYISVWRLNVWNQISVITQRDNKYTKQSEALLILKSF